MDVGIVTTHIPPAKGYGGVSVTASVLTKAWAERDHQMVLVASDESIDGRLRPEDVHLGEQVEVRLYRCYGFQTLGLWTGRYSQSCLNYACRRRWFISTALPPGRPRWRLFFASCCVARSWWPCMGA